MTSHNSQNITIGSINKSKVDIKQTTYNHEENYDFEKATIFFDSLLDRVDRLKIKPDDKLDLKEDIGNLNNELIKSTKADETRLKRLLRNIHRMAPEIFDVIFQTAINPVLGLGTVLQKIVYKLAQETGQNI